MNRNNDGHYVVVHPLHDGPEEKVQVLTPMKKTRTLFVALVILRISLIIMALVVVLAVLRLAHVV